MAIDITLSKLKYRDPNHKIHHRQFDPPDGTRTFTTGSYKSKSSNQGGDKFKGRTLGPRRKAYGPW